jgi:hypothetical protein
MTPRNGVFQVVPFDDATSDAKEPLIATSGDAKEEDQGRLEERTFARLLLASLLFGWLMGFFFSMVTADLQVGANCLVVYFEMKSNTNVIVFGLLWSLFAVLASVLLIWEFIRNLVAMTCSEQELRHDRIVWQLQCHFSWVAAASMGQAYTTMGILLGTQEGQAVYAYTNMAFCFIWYKAMTASPATLDSKPSSTRISTAEQTMMIV